MGFVKLKSVLVSNIYKDYHSEAFVSYFVLVLQKKIEELSPNLKNDPEYFKVATFSNSIVTIDVVASTVSSTIRGIEKMLLQFISAEFQGLEVKKFRYRSKASIKTL
jgi:hypothetical protein